MIGNNQQRTLINSINFFCYSCTLFFLFFVIFDGEHMMNRVSSWSNYQSLGPIIDSICQKLTSAIQTSSATPKENSLDFLKKMSRKNKINEAEIPKRFLPLYKWLQDTEKRVSKKANFPIKEIQGIDSFRDLLYHSSSIKAEPIHAIVHNDKFTREKARRQLEIYCAISDSVDAPNDYQNHQGGLGNAVDVNDKKKEEGEEENVQRGTNIWRKWITRFYPLIYIDYISSQNDPIYYEERNIFLDKLVANTDIYFNVKTLCLDITKRKKETDFSCFFENHPMLQKGEGIAYQKIKDNSIGCRRNTTEKICGNRNKINIRKILENFDSVAVGDPPKSYLFANEIRAIPTITCYTISTNRPERIVFAFNDKKSPTLQTDFWMDWEEIID